MTRRHLNPLFMEPSLVLERKKAQEETEIPPEPDPYPLENCRNALNHWYQRNFEPTPLDFEIPIVTICDILRNAPFSYRFYRLLTVDLAERALKLCKPRGKAISGTLLEILEAARHRQKENIARGFYDDVDSNGAWKHKQNQGHWITLLHCFDSTWKFNAHTEIDEARIHCALASTSCMNAIIAERTKRSRFKTNDTTKAKAEETEKLWQYWRMMFYCDSIQWAGERAFWMIPGGVIECPDRCALDALPSLETIG